MLLLDRLPSVVLGLGLALLLLHLSLVLLSPLLDGLLRHRLRLLLRGSLRLLSRRRRGSRSSGGSRRRLGERRGVLQNAAVVPARHSSPPPSQLRLMLVLSARLAYLLLQRLVQVSLNHVGVVDAIDGHRPRNALLNGLVDGERAALGHQFLVGRLHDLPLTPPRHRYHLVHALAGDGRTAQVLQSPHDLADLVLRVLDVDGSGLRHRRGHQRREHIR